MSCETRSKCVWKLWLRISGVQFCLISLHQRNATRLTSVSVQQDKNAFPALDVHVLRFHKQDAQGSCNTSKSAFACIRRSTAWVPQLFTWPPKARCRLLVAFTRSMRSRRRLRHNCGSAVGINVFQCRRALGILGLGGDICDLRDLVNSQNCHRSHAMRRPERLASDRLFQQA